MGVGVAGVPSPDQPASPVDAYLVLVSEHRHGKVDRPERLGIGGVLGLGILLAPVGLAILLPDLCRLCLPAIGDTAVLDCGLLILGVELLKHGHLRGLNGLAAHR